MHGLSGLFPALDERESTLTILTPKVERIEAVTGHRDELVKRKQGA